MLQAGEDSEAATRGTVKVVATGFTSGPSPEELEARLHRLELAVEEQIREWKRFMARIDPLLEYAEGMRRRWSWIRP